MDNRWLYYQARSDARCWLRRAPLPVQEWDRIVHDLWALPRDAWFWGWAHVLMERGNNPSDNTNHYTIKGRYTIG